MGLMMCARRDWICTLRVKERIGSSITQIGFSQRKSRGSVTIIHNKMDHSKTSSPHFSHKSKHMDSFMKLLISVTGMIAHGHGDIRYAHYGLDIFPSDSNHTVGSIAKLLRDLELPPKYSSRELFSRSGLAPLFTALLAGAEMCPPKMRKKF